MKMEDLLKLGYTKEELNKVFNEGGCINLSAKERSPTHEKDSLKISIVR